MHYLNIHPTCYIMTDITRSIQSSNNSVRSTRFVLQFSLKFNAIYPLVRIFYPNAQSLSGSWPLMPIQEVVTTTAGCWWASYSLAGNATMLVNCPTARAPMLKNALPAIRASSRCSVVQPADPLFWFLLGRPWDAFLSLLIGWTLPFSL